MIRFSTLIVVPCLVFPCWLIATSLESAVSSAMLRPPASALTIMPFTVERGAVTAESLSKILALR